MCFFFVKQKTAYEMRISDWSSDVCSSDLNSSAESIDAARPKDSEELSAIASTHDAAVVTALSPRAAHRRPGIPVRQDSQELPLQEHVSEIGRASCRDRVCQYV